VQASLVNARSGPCDRTRVAFDAHYFAERTDQTGRQHGNVPDARAKVEDALPRSDTRLTK
jgi:hypothetical protein